MTKKAKKVEPTVYTKIVSAWHGDTLCLYILMETFKKECTNRFSVKF